jgi:hypothetical protein
MLEKKVNQCEALDRLKYVIDTIGKKVLSDISDYWLNQNSIIMSGTAKEDSKYSALKNLQAIYDKYS